MKEISFFLAFSAGLLSFLSPCVLPLVPAYITFLTGSGINELKENKTKLKVLYKAVGFVIGFSIIFIIMGMSITALGKLFITNKESFSKISGVLIIIFGIHVTGLFKLKFLYKEKRILPLEKMSGTISSVFIGMAFAAGWTPCVGPILSSILLYAGSLDTVFKGGLLLSFYSLGLALPFLLTAFGIESFSTYFLKIRKYFPIISIISGILLIATGILIFTDNLKLLSGYFNFFQGL